MSSRSTTPASKALTKGVSEKTSSGIKGASLPPAFHGSASHLFHRAEQCAGDLFTRLAPPNSLTPRQFAILAAIEVNEGISQTGLVEKTGIDRSTLADIVRRMLDKDLVQRQRTAEDARAYAVRLTRKGSTMLRKMRPYAEEVDRRIVEAIPAAHRTLFLTVLAQMVDTLAAGDEPDE